jgi:osmotically inducible protein OsmC
LGKGKPDAPSVLWKSGGYGGTRTVTTDSGVLKRAKLPLGLPLKSNSHTDPDELIAAAHASSFSLALSNELELRASAAGAIVTAAIDLTGFKAEPAGKQ